MAIDRKQIEKTTIQQLDADELKNSVRDMLLSMALTVIVLMAKPNALEREPAAVNSD